MAEQFTRPFGSHGSAEQQAAFGTSDGELSDGSGLISPEPVHKPTRSRQRSLGLRVVGPLAVLGVWWLLTATGVIKPFTLASPPTVWRTFWDLLLHQNLLSDIGVSLVRATVGLAIGAGTGLILGVTVGLFALGEELLDSTLQMFRTIPFPALLFLFIAWFGIGETPKVLLIALATMFPMYLNASNGVRNVDRKVVEAARSFGLKGRSLIRQVVIPLSMPSILNGLRFSVGVSIIALVFAESIASNSGIGYLLNNASAVQNIPVIVVCIILYAILGILADLFVRTLERRLMPWRRQVAVR
jgi:sulfonate transport system permease protein